MVKHSKISSVVFCLILLLSSINAHPTSAQTDRDDEGESGARSSQQTIFLPLVSDGQVISAQQATDDTPLIEAKGQQATGFDISEKEAKAAEAYWSRAARLAAKPAPVPQLNMQALIDEADESVNAAASQPGSTKAVKPNPAADAEAQHDFAEEWQMIANDFAAQTEESVQAAGADEVTGTSGVYTTYLGNFYNELWQGFPYRATGKIYSSVGSCSASVVSSRNVIVTAAHCVYNTATNQLYTNIVFVPAERNGVRPYGTFSANAVRVLPGWVNLGSNQVSRYDVAVVRLNNNSSGRPVTFYTGALGRSWNYGTVQNITEIGYPSNLTNGSRYTYIGHAESYNGGTELLRFGSNMGFGASGSPIIRLYAPYQGGARNYVNGVQSGSSPNGTNPVYNIAPRFTTGNIVWLCNQIGC